MKIELKIDLKEILKQVIEEEGIEKVLESVFNVMSDTEYYDTLAWLLAWLEKEYDLTE